MPDRENPQGASDQLVNDPSTTLFPALADFYRENGLLSEAIEICRSGLENSPGNIEGRIVLARCHLTAGDLASARDQVTRVLAVQPENVSAKKLLAEIDQQDKKVAAAPVDRAAPDTSPSPEPAAAQAEPSVSASPSPGVRAAAVVREDVPAAREPRPVVEKESRLEVTEPPTWRGQAGYPRILQDLVQTPQILGAMLVDESGFVVASAYHPKSTAATDEEASGALAVSIFKTGQEAMQRIGMGDLEKIVIDTVSEKVFLHRAGPMLLLVSAETTAKVGLVAVNTRQAVDRVRAQNGL